MAKTKRTPELQFLPLGGSGEIGMNLNLYAYGPPGDQDWLMVDCGISFADTYLPGIDLIMPDVSFIEQHRDRLLGLIITHAHEDHVGAVAYLWPQLQCPIYATPFTAIILRGKLQELGLEDEAVVHEVPLGGNIELGPFAAEFVALTHSILEPNALRIGTPLGTIFHTGDWKLDPDPLIGPAVDHDMMQKIGDDGVLALICDSTNVFNPKPTGSEKAVRDSMIRLLADKTGQVFCATFASNVVRVETLAKVAEANGRHLCLVGRSLKRYVAAARECGYLQDFPPVIDEEEAGALPADKILYICTGCQGEARAALMRIVQDNNRNIRLNAGDTVVFSSKIIPGNELVLGRLHNKLVEKGAEVITEKDAFVHVSGHPGQPELTRMYHWTRPEISVPVHGEVRHLTRQAELARELGVPQVVVPRNGSLIRLAPGKAKILDDVEHGRLALDGQLLISDEDEAIVIRRRIMYNGGLVISIVLDRGLEPACPPDVTILGLADDEDEDLVPTIRRHVENVVRRLSAKARRNDSFLKEEVRIAARRAAKNYTGRETGPVTMVSLSRLGE